MISDMTLSKDQAKAQLLAIRKKHSMAHVADGFTDAEYKDLRQLIDNIYQSFDSADLMRRGIGVKNHGSN